MNKPYKEEFYVHLILVIGEPQCYCVKDYSFSHPENYCFQISSLNPDYLDIYYFITAKNHRYLHVDFVDETKALPFDYDYSQK